MEEELAGLFRGHRTLILPSEGASILAVSHPLFRSLTCASKLGRVKPELCFAVLVRSLRLAPKTAFFPDERHLRGEISQFDKMSVRSNIIERSLTYEHQTVRYPVFPRLVC